MNPENRHGDLKAGNEVAPVEDASASRSFEANTDPSSAESQSNIVRYQRRGEGLQLAAAETRSEILFIDENTPTPPMPPRQPYVPVGRRRPSDDETLYIGPE